MTIYLATNSLYMMRTWTNSDENTTSGRFDSSFVPFGLRIASGTMQGPDLGALTSVWIHFEYIATGYTSGVAPHTYYNNAGTAVVRLHAVSAGNLTLQWWDGATWTSLGSGTAMTADTLYQIDVHIEVAGGSTIIEWYRDKVLIDSATGAYSSISDIDYWVWTAIGTTGSHRGTYSQIVVSDVSSLNFKYKLNVPTGNGANTSWTGDYTAVDEIPYNVSDYIYSGTANQVETFTAAARTFTGYSVKAVVIDYFALKGSSGPSQIQSAFRIGSTDYFGSTRGLLHGFTGLEDIYETDPSTGLTWAPADAASAALEFGVKSIT